MVADPVGHTTPPKPTSPVMTKQFSPGETARFESYLIERASGVAVCLGVSLVTAKSLLFGAQASNSPRVNALQASGESGIIADTGATVNIIGETHLHLVRNKRMLDRVVLVNTDDGVVEVNSMGDLPGLGGLMKGCLIIPSSKASLLSVVGTCEELGGGYQIHQGSLDAEFNKDGQTVISLNKVGLHHVLPLDGKIQNIKGSENSSESHVYLVCALEQELDEELKELHKALVPERCEILSNSNSNIGAGVVNSITGAGVVNSEGVNQNRNCENESDYSCYGCTVLSNSAMLEHRLGGHSRFSDKCPECIQGKLRARQSLRKMLGGAKANPAGRSISIDFTGPHTEGVAGGKYALVGVELEHDWGYVGIQNDRTASNTLKSIQDLECEIKNDSGNHDIGIVSIHHDDDKSFRGEVEVYAREKGWVNTHTGGYNPNANSKCERRIGMLQQLFRVVLLVATGGVFYYDQLWDVGLKYSNWIINNQPWPDRPSPNSTLSNFPIRRSKNAHVFGAYCLFHIPKELRDGKFRPPSEMGIWVGLDSSVINGHLVVPIEWQHSTQSWVLEGVKTATTVKVYDNVFPLKMAPPPGAVGTTKFDEYVDSVVNPLYREKDRDGVETETPEVTVLKKTTLRKSKSSKSKSSHDTDNWEVEKITGSRVKKGVKQYRIKWKGFSKQDWVKAVDVNSPELELEFNLGQTGRSREDVIGCLAALLVDRKTESHDIKAILPGLDVGRAVENLMFRQSVEGSAEKFAEGIVTELSHMLDKRLELISDPELAARLMKSEPVVSLRMQLEAKKDGRSKARLLLQGFKEPAEWDLRSNVSPVVFPSTIKTLLFRAGPAEDVISSIDVSVAFLQADRYGPDEKPRYVSYRAYPGGPMYMFKLLGPIYGQRSAPRAWYETLTTWLVKEMGYRQAQNDPCLFTHQNGHCLVIHVDDILCRGSQEISDEFYRCLAVKFECKDPTFLIPGGYLTFTGMDIGLEIENGELIYSVSQERELLEFLKNKGLDSEPKASNPMPNRNTILAEGEVDEKTGSWIRSCIGGLHYFSRMTRWDIAHAVSRIGQTTQTPKQGSVDQLKQLAGFLNNTSGYKIRGQRVQGKDEVITMTDSNHHGDPKFTSKSQTGVIILLNGIPVHWRSNRQPRSTLSPAESEIYALSTGVKDSRLFHWVLEEFTNIETVYPIQVLTDSTGARSFQRDTCPGTRLRGCFDFREKWVEELREQGQFSTELVSDSSNLADIFTKCLSNVEFVLRRGLVVDFQGAR